MKATKLNIALAFTAVYVIWGSTYLAIRFAVESLPPFLLAGGRFAISGAALYAIARRSGAPAPEAAHWRSATLVGALLLLGGNGGVVWAERFVPSGVASLVVATVPLWMVLLDALAKGRRPSPLVLAGLAAGFAGVWLLVRPDHASAEFPPVAAAVLLMASFSWGAGSVLAGRLRLPKSQLLTVGMEMIGGGACLFAVSALTGEFARFDPAAVTLRSFLSWFYLVSFGSFVGFTAYVWLLKTVPISRVSTYAYVNPVVAVFLGWAFAGESLTPGMALAAAVILVSVILIQSSEKTKVEPDA